MTARISIDRDDIVAAALDIVKEAGWEAGERAKHSGQARILYHAHLLRNGVDG